MAFLRIGPEGPPSFVASEPDERLAPRAASFQVTYDGFTPAAKRAFQRAVNIWSSVLNSPVPITIRASFEPLEPGILGAAGPWTYRANFSGAPRQNTWFAEAIANKRFGRQIDPGSPDIIATFSRSFTDWHFGADRAPPGKIDFTAVVLHELGHGLGISGGAQLGGFPETATLRQFSGLPFSYSLFTENGAGKRLLNFPDLSISLAGQLQSRDVFFDSRRVRRANRDKRAKLFAPRSFQPGSSYSHLDEATYPKGSKNSLMTPFIGRAETIRSPGPITRAILKDIGW
jgi:hypothetical protein